MNLHREWLTQATAAVLVAFSAAAGAQNVTTVSISGTVSGEPESVVFSGHAKVTSKLASDPPSLMLMLDLRGVSGVGSATGTKYVISGPEVVQRAVATTHVIEVTFPFLPSESNMSAPPRPGVAAFALDFDPSTGAITGASGYVATPRFP